MIDTYKTVFGESSTTFTPSEIQQHGEWGCALKCQSLIMNKYGLDISEEQLTQEGLENGWYIDGAGTPLSDVGKLLNLHGIDTTTITNANQYTLMHELAQGHQVIVGVDAFELDSNLLVQFLSRTTDNPNHAILVTGIDATDPENVQVIVTDPGSGEFTSYPWKQFAEAWGDSQFHMVATTEPPPTDFSQPFDADFTSSLLMSVDITPDMYAGDYQIGSMGSEFGQQDCDLLTEHSLYETIAKEAMSLDSGEMDLFSIEESNSDDLSSEIEKQAFIDVPGHDCTLMFDSSDTGMIDECSSSIETICDISVCDEIGDVEQDFEIE